MNRCFDYNSVYDYFFADDGVNYNNNFDPKRVITELFDPLLIDLYQEDYEVNVQRINVEAKVYEFSNQIYQQVSELEQSYYEGNYQRVGTLGSTILQSIFKQMCSNAKLPIKKNVKFPQLFSTVKELFKLDPKLYENQDLKKFTSYLNIIVIKINEMRNLHSDSHGMDMEKSLVFSKIPPHHMKFIVDSTKTIVNFMVNT
ncbi:abortive infection family protein [Mycoplasmatota bacterium zrk1]